MENQKWLHYLTFIFCLNLLSQEEKNAYLFSLDYLYPQTYFYRFEAASKELWSDLDLLYAQKDSLDYALKNNYLKTQFYKLHAAAKMLCAHKNEARNYLPDDIEYLIEIVQVIAEKSVKISEILPEQFNYLAEEFFQLLYATKMALETLLLENEEIVLS